MLRGGCKDGKRDVVRCDCWRMGFCYVCLQAKQASRLKGANDAMQAVWDENESDFPHAWIVDRGVIDLDRVRLRCREGICDRVGGSDHLFWMEARVETQSLPILQIS